MKSSGCTCLFVIASRDIVWVILIMLRNWQDVMLEVLDGTHRSLMKSPLNSLVGLNKKMIKIPLRE